jgi:hypothetical protein
MLTSLSAGYHLTTNSWLDRTKFKIQKLYYDRRSFGQSVLMSSPIWGPMTRFLLLSGSYGFVDMGRPLWRENGSDVYNCCWPSPVHTFSGPSPTGLMTVFYCLRFETALTWRVRSPYLYFPGRGWPSFTSRHRVLFSLPPKTHRATVKYSKASFALAI